MVGIAQHGKRIWILAALALFAALAALALHTSRNEQHPPARSVILSSDNFLLSGLIYIALDRGFFERQGLRVSLQRAPTGKASIEHLVAGRVDLAVAAQIPVAFAVMSGQALVVVASLGDSDGGAGVVALRERGIARAEDLRGKRIGVPMGTSGHYYLDRLLLKADMASTEVSLVDLRADTLVAKLAAGEIDAVATWDPILSQAQAQLGDRAVTINPPHLVRLVWNILVTRDYLARNPGVVKSALLALADAEAFLAQHPQEARQIIATYLGLDGSALDRIWDANHLELSLDQSLITALEEISRWAIATGQPGKPSGSIPNYLDHIDIMAMSAVKPAGVTIIR